MNTLKTFKREAALYGSLCIKDGNLKNAMLLSKEKLQYKTKCAKTLCHSSLLACL